MKLNKLHLLQFRNIEELSFNFSKSVIIIVGENGIGKTNLLDAIYHLAFTKSYFSHTENTNINHQHDFFFIEGVFENNDFLYDISCSVRRKGGKIFKCNGKEYLKISEHIGKIPIVFITPQDLNLITEYADTRRKFLDVIISKYDKQYLEALIQYNKVLQNRNSLVKNNALYTQKELVSIYNQQLNGYGSIILEKRNQFFTDTESLIQDIYAQLQGNKETLLLKYQSTIKGSFIEQLENSIEKDMRVGYTSVGTHRDDFDILLNNYSVKQYASQGQQKSVIFALKWLELIFLKNKTNISPILLIDDMCDKLDDTRLKKIKEMLSTQDIGQVFITDSNAERIRNLFFDVPTELFDLSDKSYEPV